MATSTLIDSHQSLRTWRPLRLCGRHYPGESTVKSPIIVRDGASFVCRPLPTNKNSNSLRTLRLCGDFLNELAVRRYALCAMRFAISVSALIGENLRLIILTLRTMRHALCRSQSAKICVNLRLIFLYALRHALCSYKACCLLPTAYCPHVCEKRYFT